MSDTRTVSDMITSACDNGFGREAEAIVRRAAEVAYQEHACENSYEAAKAILRDAGLEESDGR